jgi:hypothetical protein
LNFLEHLHFGAIHFPDFIDYINSIQFHELNSRLFDHLKYSLFYSHFLLAEKDSSQKETQHLLFLSEFISSYSQIYKENQDLNILKISYSATFDHFEINPSEKDQIWFTSEQQNIMSRYPFIHLLSGTISSFQEINVFTGDCLFIFIPNSIQTIPKDCFHACS